MSYIRLLSRTACLLLQICDLIDAPGGTKQATCRQFASAIPHQSPTVGAAPLLGNPDGLKVGLVPNLALLADSASLHNEIA